MSSTENQNDKPADLATPPAPPAGDVESRTQGSGFGAAGILRRWRREDLLKRGLLALRGLAFLFSVLALIITASNKHGDWRNFDKYEEYRYLLAIAILSTLYTGLQALRQVHELSTGKQLFPPRHLALFDFVGDQIAAYFLISAASAATPLTDRMREGADNIFTDSSAAAICMTFLAFFALAFSALISGHRLSNRSSI